MRKRISHSFSIILIMVLTTSWFLSMTNKWQICCSFVQMERESWSLYNLNNICSYQVFKSFIFFTLHRRGTLWCYHHHSAFFQSLLPLHSFRISFLYSYASLRNQQALVHVLSLIVVMKKSLKILLISFLPLWKANMFIRSMIKLHLISLQLDIVIGLELFNFWIVLAPVWPFID